MKLNVYAVHDSAVGAYLQPFFMRTNGEAVRAFASVANQRGHAFHNNGEDYTLFRIAEYVEEDGTLVPLPAKESLGKAIDFKEYDDAGS